MKYLFIGCLMLFSLSVNGQILTKCDTLNLDNIKIDSAKYIGKPLYSLILNNSFIKNYTSYTYVHEPPGIVSAIYFKLYDKVYLEAFFDRIPASKSNPPFDSVLEMNVNGIRITYKDKPIYAIYKY